MISKSYRLVTVIVETNIALGESDFQKFVRRIILLAKNFTTAEEQVEEITKFNLRNSEISCVCVCMCV